MVIKMKTSSLEEYIIKILQKEKIKFQREKTYPDLKFGYYRFDFFLLQYNLLIEVDGAQHYKFSKIFHKKRQDFLKAQERDRRKNSYALSHNIPLYRIPYFEIENIHTFQDILQDKFLVKDKWHCDNVARLLSK
jgi:very-short-patch-repair endonuclease